MFNLGTGFSFVSGRSVPTSQAEINQHFYSFLQALYKLHPAYKDRALFLAGDVSLIKLGMMEEDYTYLSFEVSMKRKDKARSTKLIYIHVVRKNKPM